MWLDCDSTVAAPPAGSPFTNSGPLQAHWQGRRWGNSNWHSSCVEFVSCPRFQETNLGCSPVHQAELRKLNKAGEICEEKADKQSAWVQRLFAPATEKTALPARLLSSACLLGEWETEASRPRGMEFSHAALTGVVVCLVLSVGSQCLRSSCCCYWLFPDHLKSVGWKYYLLASALPLLATLGQKQVISNELDDLN